VSARSCGYYNNTEKESGTKEFLDTLGDIEDLVKYGIEHRACPYYLARRRIGNADIVLAPYNYVLDPRMRAQSQLDIDGAIVIVDEAHNIESVCEDAAGFVLSALDIAGAVNDVQRAAEVCAIIIRFPLTHSSLYMY